MSDYSQTVLTLLKSEYLFFLDGTLLQDNLEVLNNLERVSISTKNDENEEHPILPSLQKAFKKLITVSVRNGEETDDDLFNRVDTYLCTEANKSEFVDSLTDAPEIIESKKRFETEKNKYITMVAKNNNVEKKFTKSKLLNIVFIVTLIIYIIGQIFIYVSGRNGYFKKGIDFQILAGVSLTVMFIFLGVDMYQRFTKKTFVESFDELPARCFNVENRDSYVTTFINSLEAIHHFNEELKQKEITKQNEVIDSIISDYDNMNYVNMRTYQQTEYRIQNNRNDMHFVKYGFLIASIIGVLASLNLRGKKIGHRRSFLISDGMLVGISGIFVFTFFSIFLLHTRQNMIRKKYNWDKFYWNMKLTQKETP
jgi:hypothetical protein